MELKNTFDINIMTCIASAALVYFSICDFKDRVINLSHSVRQLRASARFSLLGILLSVHCYVRISSLYMVHLFRAM